MQLRVNPSGGQPIYLQLMQQVRHAIETGVLVDGDVLPGIRTLAEELLVSHNTIAKAYAELAREGLIDLRHGSGAYVTADHGTRSRAHAARKMQERVHDFIQELRRDGFAEEEILRMVEAELFYKRRRTSGR